MRRIIDTRPLEGFLPSRSEYYSYYDATTGALVATYDLVLRRPVCMTGAMDTIPPDCVPDAPTADASVAGTDICATDAGAHD